METDYEPTIEIIDKNIQRYENQLKDDIELLKKNEMYIEELNGFIAMNSRKVESLKSVRELLMAKMGQSS